MRMSMRRFTRLTNAVSKKLDNHLHALALYFVFYNFCRIHKTLRFSRAMLSGYGILSWPPAKLSILARGFCSALLAGPI
jgi:hypothetical protein